MTMPLLLIMAASLLSVVLDGTPVDVRVERVSCRTLDALAGLVNPRGAVVDRDALQDLHLARAAAVDRHVLAAPGALEVDGQPAGRFGAIVGGRADLVEELFYALLHAQTLTGQERRDLEVAARFSVWLEEAQHKAVASPWVETGLSCGACRQARLCGRRGCDGTPKTRAVWHAQRFVTMTCPVRSFTVDVERALRTFYWTHELRREGWYQIAWPVAGGLEDQEAWMLAALGALRRVHNELSQSQADGGQDG